MRLHAIAGKPMTGVSTDEVWAALANNGRPLAVTFFKLESSEAAEALRTELVQTTAKLRAVEADGARVLEHMYHLEDDAAALKVENERLSGLVQIRDESLQKLDANQQEMQNKLQQALSELDRERSKSARLGNENLGLRDRLTRLADQYEQLRDQLAHTRTHHDSASRLGYATLSPSPSATGREYDRVSISSRPLQSVASTSRYRAEGPVTPYRTARERGSLASPSPSTYDAVPLQTLPTGSTPGEFDRRV